LHEGQISILINNKSHKNKKVLVRVYNNATRVFWVTCVMTFDEKKKGEPLITQKLWWRHN
jgi:hypothetical protein